MDEPEKTEGEGDSYKEKREPGVRLVLNGNQPEMDTATIPIEWFFTEETIQKKPGYLVFIEQNESELNDDNNSMKNGRRYMCPIDKAVFFMQIFHPGKHRITTLVLNNKKEARRCIEQNQYGLLYCMSIYQNQNDDNGIKYFYPSIIANNVADFEVPKELFAQKPRKGFLKGLWEWVNSFYEKAPRDQCHYRKRVPITIFLAAPLYYIGRYFCKYGIGGTAYALYILLASIGVFLIGFRPRPILKEMWRAFTFKREAELDVVEKMSCPACKRTHYYLWRVWQIKHDKEDANPEYTMMAVTPINIVGIVGAAFILYWGLTRLELWWLALIGGTLFSILAALAIVSFLFSRMSTENRKKRTEEHEQWLALDNAREEALRIAEEQKYLLWLKQNFLFSKMPNKVDLGNLPVPLTKTGAVIQTFRVSYWALKMKVCRPYPRG